MGLKVFGALFVAAAVAFTAWPADAQPRKRTKIVVTKRSYLDAGTEAIPGDRKFTDYVFPPNYSAHSYYDPTGSYRHPLPNSFWLPGAGNSGFGY